MKTLFSKQEVLDQVSKVQSGEMFNKDSPVVQRWMELADEWLLTGDYHESGFTGFNDRSPNDVLLDFHLNDLLETPLDTNEVNALLQERKTHIGDT